MGTTNWGGVFRIKVDCELQSLFSSKICEQMVSKCDMWVCKWWREKACSEPSRRHWEVFLESSELGKIKIWETRGEGLWGISKLPPKLKEFVPILMYIKPCLGCQFLRHYFIIYHFTWPWARKTSFISQLCCSWLWPLCQDISAVTDPKSILLQTSHKKQPLVPKEINQFSKERFFTWPSFESEGFENTKKWLSVVLLS